MKVKMKINWFFVVILLLANFTLIESVNRKPSLYVRRRIYRPKSGSTRYFGFQKIEAKKNDWIETPPPVSPDRSLNNAKRLNYLATHKKEVKSNIGRILSGS